MNNTVIIILDKKLFKVICFIIVFYLVCYTYTAYAEDNYGKFYDEMKVAKNILNQSKLNEAIAVYSAILLKDPNYTPAKLELGNIYSRQAKYIDAEKVFLSVINTNSNNADAYQQLALNYYYWSESDQENKHYLINKGIEAIQKAIEIDSYKDNFYSTYALLNIAKENYTEALNNLNKAININTNCQEAYINLGILYNKLSKYDLSLQNFQKAIEINSSTPRPYKELAKMLINAKQYRQAVDYFKTGQFYDIFTTYQDYFLIGTVYEKLSMPKEAIDSFTKCLDQKPNYVDCYTHIAELFEVLDLNEQSVEAYRKAIKLDPGILEGFLSNAQDYFIQGDLISARPLFIKVLKIDPANKYAYQGLTSLYYLTRLQNNFDSVKWYMDRPLLQEQLSLFKNDAYVENLCWLKFLISKEDFTESTINSLAGLTRINPKTPDDFIVKGEALFLLNKYQAANDILAKSADKYFSYYTEINSSANTKDLFSTGLRLFSIHELLVSREIFDKINNISKSNKAVKVLSAIANTKEKAETLLEKFEDFRKKTKSIKEVIDYLNEIKTLYPQNSLARFLLSDLYAESLDYNSALNELIICNDLKNLTPSTEIPGTETINKLLEKYQLKINTAKNLRIQ